MVVAQDEIGRVYTDSADNRVSAEAVLWGALQAQRNDFRRDQQFGRYRVDFYSEAAHLAVQIDRGERRGDETVRSRDLRLEALGIRVVHIPCTEVLKDVNSVIESLSPPSR